MFKQNEISVQGNPDCVTLFSQGFCISTYTLDKDSGCKTGSLQFFRPDLVWKCDLDAGVLDTKLIDQKLLSCCSDGSLVFCNHRVVETRLKISEGCLSYLDSNSQKVFISGLDGNLHTVDLETLNVSTQKMNPYEIWFVACTENVLCVPLSIGKIMIQDLRTETDKHLISLHDSEVCSVLIRDDFVFCGSFDGTISVTDRRMMKKLKSFEIGGGVWRMCERGEGFVTANMEEGFKFTTATEQQVVPSNSLAYSLAQLSENLYLGCSFYDSKVLYLSIPDSLEG